MGTAKTASTPMEKTFCGTGFEPCQTDGGLTEPIQPIQRYRQIVNHFEQVARANLGAFVQVADLSHIAGFNQRRERGLDPANPDRSAIMEPIAHSLTSNKSEQLQPISTTLNKSEQFKGVLLWQKSCCFQPWHLQPLWIFFSARSCGRSGPVQTMRPLS